MISRDLHFDDGSSNWHFRYGHIETAYHGFVFVDRASYCRFAEIWFNSRNTDSETHYAHVSVDPERGTGHVGNKYEIECRHSALLNLAGVWMTWRRSQHP